MGNTEGRKDLGDEEDIRGLPKSSGLLDAMLAIPDASVIFEEVPWRLDPLLGQSAYIENMSVMEAPYELEGQR